METKVLNCVKCGSQIKDSNYLLSIGMKEPKYCELCKREMYNYRYKKQDVQREEIQRWDNVVIESIYLKYEKTLENKNQNSIIMSFGGRSFGKSSWSGVAYTDKYLFFVSPIFCNRAIY